MSRTIEEIRDVWLTNRSADGSNWQAAISAVYDFAVEDCALLVSPPGHEGERDCREIAAELRRLKVSPTI